MKKTVLFLVMVFGAVTLAFSQKIIDEQIKVNGKSATMKLSFADDIVLEAWNKDYIQLRVEVNIDENKYNEHYALEIEKDGQTIKILEKIDFDKIKSLKGNKKNCNFNSEIHYALQIPNDLKLSLETISGEVELKGCKGEMDINSISGFIDYSIPTNHKANIDLSTISGDVYSNVKFDKKQSEEISWVGTKEKLLLNGGSTEVELKTISGDIYLREF